MEIPKININKVEIHEIPIWKTDVPKNLNISKPIVDIPGCVRVHRNNLTSLIDNDKDEYGTYTECGNFSIPSFEPLQYNPNEFKLERVIGHERSEDGSKCITLYEDVKFIEQYIPNPPQLVSTAVIATVAASTPLLLNIVKPLVKNLIKKLTKKKKDIK